MAWSSSIDGTAVTCLAVFYDMEVSEKVKELLRPYNGQAILLDAKEVVQRMNSGDGRITKLEVLGPAAEPRTHGDWNPLLAGLDCSSKFSCRRSG